jgi:hypothetical protein
MVVYYNKWEILIDELRMKQKTIFTAGIKMWFYWSL